MRHIPRLVPVVAATAIALNCTIPALASAEGCPGCASNSPIINPFAIMWLRGESMPVLKNNSACKAADTKGAHLGVAKLADDPNSRMRGYQLVVTADDKILCSGSELTGIAFRLSSRYGEPAIIRQVAKTTVAPDRPENNVFNRDEDRYVYFISAAGRPNDSLCNFGLKDSLPRRVKRRFISYKIPDFSRPQISKQEDLFAIYQDRLMDYAVIIPNAEYDSDGEPSPHCSQSQRSDDVWFEFACAGGALAHTDLKGLVDVGASLEIRTAAIRMFRAQYNGKDVETRHGIPIYYERGELLISYESTSPKLPDTSHCSSTKPLDEASDVGGIEAKWNDRGAVCVSHSRLWMRDSVISDSRPSSANGPGVANATENAFIRQFNKPLCNDSFKGYFTSRVIHHIGPQAPAPTGQASSAISHP
jgi:hypothetical protein